MIKFYNLDPSLKGMIGDIPRFKRHVIKIDAGNHDFVALRSESAVYHSITDALSEAEDYDDIVVWPGEWTEDATINITQAGLRLRAYQVGSGPGLSPVELWQYAGTNTPVITVAAKGVEICGLQILPYNDVDAVGISVGTAVESKYCYIHDNYLRAIAATNMPTLISVGTAGTFDAQMCMIENNYFRQGGCSVGSSAQIYLGQGTGTTIRGNNFLIAGNSTNYNCINAGTAIVQRIVVQSNLFMAFEAGGCLAIDDGTGTTTVGHMYIDDNHFIGFADNDACFDYNTDNAGINYLNGVAITT